jgi:hypothetical protein
MTESPRPIEPRPIAVHIPSEVLTPPAVGAPPRRTEVPRTIVDLPPISSTLPPGSGLEIVETRSHPAPEPEPESMPAPRRVRPPRVAIPDEPLQIVETRKGEQPPPG